MNLKPWELCFMFVCLFCGTNKLPYNASISTAATWSQKNECTKGKEYKVMHLSTCGKTRNQ